LLSELPGRVAGDWPLAAAVNNVTEVNANAIASLMYARLNMKGSFSYPLA
jgi:hypothetical protein